MTMSEAARQQAVLAALRAPRGMAEGASLRETGGRAARGLDAYRDNAWAIAERALAAAFPTISPMVGPDNFKHLSREFWRDHPPSLGDLGEWGESFPGWLEAHRAMAAWPWLGDCARLDWLLHRCERAADAVLDAASLALLETTDPERLCLRPMPGLAVLRSRWPVALVHEAHHHNPAAFDELPAALAEPRGQTVLVARDGWRAVVHVIDGPTAAWTESLLAGHPLARALDDAGPGFDFAVWLGAALRAAWLKEAAAFDD